MKRRVCRQGMTSSHAPCHDEDDDVGGELAWRVPPRRVPVLRDATLAVRGRGCVVLRVATVGERAGRLRVRDGAVSITGVVDLAARGLLRRGCVEVESMEEVCELSVRGIADCGCEALV